MRVGEEGRVPPSRHPRRLERRRGYAHLEITGRLALALEVKAEELLARKYEECDPLGRY